MVNQDVNNHIHTYYSFSPYSPYQAVKRAKDAGLVTAGIMDHDSLAGADEFEQAGRQIGLPTTVGMEIRADFSSTMLLGKQINNPDQKSIAYMAFHAIPKASRLKLINYMIPYVEARQVRNKIMTRKLHTIVREYGFSLDFEKDVIPLSMSNSGGSVTERHILFALALKVVAHYGKTDELVCFLREKLNIMISEKTEKMLTDENNPYITYDLLGLLKSSLISSFYLDATSECPDVRELIKIGHESGAICAYAYLGDVTESVTGDKKAQKFEDEYIELLFETIKSLGFHAVTYMPSRNTPEQLEKLRSLCNRYSLFQISGEDINSPRQTFVCEAMRKPELANLADAAWALIGHEIASVETLANGMFSQETMKKMPLLTDRVQHFSSIGRLSIDRIPK